jgi:hypothetical protein
MWVGAERATAGVQAELEAALRRAERVTKCLATGRGRVPATKNWRGVHR